MSTNPASAMSAAHNRTGEMLFASMEKMNSEILTMTYGAFVIMLLKDYNNDIPIVNNEIEKIGFNIGVRLIDEFLAKSNLASCSNFRETANIIGRVALKMFLGMSVDVSKWTEDGRSCSLLFKGNPLIDCVVLPDEYQELQYSNLLLGAIRGACNAVNVNVECRMLKDELRGANETEIRLTFKEMFPEVYNDEEEK